MDPDPIAEAHQRPTEKKTDHGPLSSLPQRLSFFEPSVYVSDGLLLFLIKLSSHSFDSSLFSYSYVLFLPLLPLLPI